MSTARGLKTALLIAGIAAVFTACTHKRKYYTCMCNARIQGAGRDSAYDIGEVSQSVAYSQCFAHNDSVDTCVMMVMQ